MHIICLTPLAPGVYNDHSAEHITTPPAGWAYIPEDFPLPSTFPRLGSLEAELKTYTREVEVEKEVTKTREVETMQEVTKFRDIESVDEEGNPVTVIEEYTELEPITVTEEYTEMETVTEEQEYTMLTVKSMTEGTLPEPTPETEPKATTEERLSDLEETTAQQGEILNILLSGETEESV